jgi:hypothetical protein
MRCQQHSHLLRFIKDVFMQAQAVTPQILPITIRPATPKLSLLQQALAQLELVGTQGHSYRLWGYTRLAITIRPEQQDACLHIEGDITTRARVLYMLKSPNRAFRLTPCVSAPLQPENDVILSLKELYWHFSMYLSEAALIPALAKVETFQLSHWPNFGALGRSPAHMRISALLNSRKRTFAEIQNATQADPADIAAFLNGAYLVGCLTLNGASFAQESIRRPAKVVTTRTLQPVVATLFSRFRSAFWPVVTPQT